MTDDVTKKLEARKADIEKEAQQLTEQQGKVIEQGKVLNRQHSDIQARLAQLQGAYAEVKTLLGEPLDQPKQAEEPKKKK